MINSKTKSEAGSGDRSNTPSGIKLLVDNKVICDDEIPLAWASHFKKLSICMVPESQNLRELESNTSLLHTESKTLCSM